MAQYDPVQDKRVIERAYWVATHRLAIEKWTTISLYSFIALVYIFFFAQFGLYLYQANDWGSYVSASLQPTLDWKSVHAARAPKDLVIGTAAILVTGDNRYTLAVDVQNPNSDWAIESVDYTLAGNGMNTPVRGSTFFAPGERKYLTKFQYASLTRPQNLSLTLEQIVWRRAKSLPKITWVATEEPRLHARQVVINEGVQKIVPAHVSRSMQNTSAYNLRSVLWQVAFLQGDALLSLQEYTGEEMTFLQTSSYDLSLYENIPQGARIQITPIINIFDPSFSYIPTD